MKFHFDRKFMNDFLENDDQITIWDAIKAIISMVRNGFRDHRLKRLLGTTINIVTKNSLPELHHNTIFGWDLSHLSELASRFADINTFVTYPGARGNAFSIGTVCEMDKTRNINWNAAYGPGQCNKNCPDEELDCTLEQRIALTAQVNNSFSFFTCNTSP